MKFHINAQGDRTVGDGNHYACVDIPEMIEDPEYIESARETLQDAFSTIFDNRKARVQTDDEYRDEELANALSEALDG